MSKAFRTKEEARQTLTTISWMFIAFAIISMVMNTVGFASGSFQEQAQEALATMEEIAPDMVAGIAGGIVTGLFVVAIALGLLQIFVGYKGLREAGDAKQGGGYLVLVIIYMVLSGIAVIATAYNAINTGNASDNWFSIGMSLTDLLGAILIYVSAKELREGKRK